MFPRHSSDVASHGLWHTARSIAAATPLAIVLAGLPLAASHAVEADPISAHAAPVAGAVANATSFPATSAANATPNLVIQGATAEEKQRVVALFSREGMQQAATQAATQTGELVMRALSLIGVRYRRGGNSEESGLDCSGLVDLVFRDTLGLKLPRRAEEISKVGDKVDKEELKPGDLVFFNTLRRAFSHVGIYLGDGRFVHAPSKGSQVRVESMDQPYWTKRFNGARRVSKED